MISINFTTSPAKKSFFLASLALLFSLDFSFGQNILEPPLSLGSGSANSVEIYDFDGDGDNDVVRFGTDGQVRWHENVDGKLETALPTNPPIAVSSGFAVDFDKDGDRDLVVSRVNQIFWFENLDGKSNFNDGTFIAPGGEFFVEDLDGDGDFDILPQQTATIALIWYKNLGNNMDFELASIPYESNHANAIVAECQENINYISVFDNSFSGRSDIVAYSRKSGSNGNASYVVRISNYGNGSFNKNLSEVFTWPSGASGNSGSVKFLRQFDFFFDGKREIASLKSISSLNGYTSFICIGETVLTEVDKIYIKTLSPPFKPPFVDFLSLDLDGNGKEEIIASREKWLTFYPEFPSSTIKIDSIFHGDGYSFTSPMAKGDLDGDGTDELFCTVNGNLSVFGGFLKGGFLFKSTGSVFFDKNENGQKDPGEPNLSNQIVQLTPNFYSAFSQDSTGFSILAVAPSGTQLKCLPDSNWEFTTPAVVQFNFSHDTTVHFDFGLKPKTIFTNGKIDISASFPRCNGEVATWLTVQNSGTAYLDGLVSLNYTDTLATFLAAVPQPDSVFGSTYFWKINQLPPTNLKKISVINKIAGATNIGKQVVFAPILQVFDATGAVVSTFTSFYNETLRCGWDPNDKLIAPDQPGSENYIFKNSELNFTVRFQNTGNDTAFSVKILDKLDINLDWKTLRIIAHSHQPTAINLDERNLLTIEFANIALPDSTTDFARSKGFVKFAIQPKKGLPADTKISNQAKIIFDSNPEIPTNLVNTRVSNSLFTIKTRGVCATEPEGWASVYPNFIENEKLEYDWGFSNQPEVLFSTAGEFPLKIKMGGAVILDTILTIKDALFNISATYSNPSPSLANGWIKLSVNGLNAPFTYLWDTPNADTVVKITNLAAGTYHCTVTNKLGCSKIFTIVLENIVSENEPGLPPLVQMEVLPNPNRGHFNLKIDVQTDANFVVEITNSLGILERTFDPKNFQNSSNSLKISGLGAGLHFVNLKIGSSRVVKRVVVFN